MAEALVEERPAMPTRYYCHMCNVEINIPNENFTCPLCAGGFVEELPAPPPLTDANSAAGASTSTSRSGTNAESNTNGAQPAFNRISDLNDIRGEIATILLDRYGPNIEISLDPTRTGNVVATSTPGGGNIARVVPPRMRRNFGPNVLIDFLNSLDGQFGNTSMVYLGNIGDYAWGREGIDTIVTQLLNQMETAGPPPLPKEKIDEIPKVQVTQEDVDNNTQCSVCWEDFVLGETVRKLPCSHIYHENCIVPWLDLHGTCPICRQSLSNENDEMHVDDTTMIGVPSNDSNRRPDGNAGGGGSNPQRRAGGYSRDPPTMRNNALDDLD